MTFEASLLTSKALAVVGFVGFSFEVGVEPALALVAHATKEGTLNFELSVIAYDTSLSQSVRALQKRYEADSKALELTAWQQRSPLRRLAENTARLASPLL